MTTFSDFYRQQAAAGGAQLPAAPHVIKTVLPSIQAAQKQIDQQNSPLNWLMDIVSRPLFGVENVINNKVDTLTQAAKDGGIGAVIGEGLKQLVTPDTSFTDALVNTSNDPNLKRSTSQTIEHATDTIGSINPAYQNTQDNVNPVLKGVLGFAGDVALDPLTWIPGGVLLKGAKAGLEAGKTAAEGAVDIAKGIKSSEKVPAEALPVETAAVKAGDKITPTPAPEANPFADMNPKDVKIPELKPAEAPKVEVPKAVAETDLKAPEVAQAADAVKAAQVEPNLRQLFNESPRLPKLRDEIKSIVETVGKGVTKDVPVDNIGTWFKANKDVKAPRVQLPGDATIVNRTYHDLNRVLAAERSRPGALSARGKAAKNIIEGGYQDYRDATHATRSTEVLSSLDEFARRRQENEARVTEALGAPLVQMMRAKRSPARFDEMMQHIGQALDPASDLHTFYAKHPQLGSAIQEGLGIPAHVKPLPNTPEDLAHASETFTAPNTAVADALAKVLTEDTAAGGAAWRKKWPVQRGNLVYSSHKDEIRDGNHWRKLNSFFQYSMYRSLTDELKKRMAEATGKEQLFGAANARAWRDAILSTGDEMVTAAQTFGTKLHIGVDADLLPITFPEVYRLTEASFSDGNKALLSLYNQGSSVPFTVLMQATQHAALAGDLQALGKEGVLQLRQEVIDILENPKKYGRKGGLTSGDMPNHINEQGASGFSFPPNQQKAAAAAAKQLGGKVVKTKGGAWQVKLGKGALIPDLADAIVKAQPKVAERIDQNALMWKNRGLAEAADLSNKQIKDIRELLSEDAYKAQYLHAVNEIPANVAKDGSVMGTTQEAVGIGTQTATGVVGDMLENDAKAATGIDRALKTEEIEPSVEKGVQDQIDNVIKFDDVTPPPEGGAIVVPETPELKLPKLDLADEGQQFNHIVESRIPGVSWANKQFNHKYGRERVEPIQASAKAASSLFMEQKTHAAAQIAKTWDQETLQASFRALQHGDTPAHLSEPIAALQRELGSLFNMTGEKSILSNFFLSTEKDLNHINDVLRYNKTDLEFNYQEAKAAAVEANGVKKPTADMIAEQLDKQWRSVDVKDPAAWLVRTANAATTIAEHRSLVGGFVNRFTKLGLFSTEPKPGMVKIVDSKGGTIRSLLPKNSYADPVLAGELRRMNVLMGQSREIEGDIGKFLRENYFPVQNLWKQYMTIFRPGHHIRNFIGDSSVTAVARGAYRFPDSYKDAFKVLGVKNDYTDMDLIDSLKRIEGDNFTLPQTGDVVVKGTLKGKPVELTNEDIHQMLTDNGLINTFTHAEDLLTDAELSSKVQRATQKLSLDGTGVKRLAAGTSESVAHIGRAAHFIQALKQELSKQARYHQHGGSQTLDELVQKVANEVRRAHPDGTMLTNFEHKYLRVLIPFYSWFSKTLPFMLEAAARNPARVTAIPKASYNLAVSMGINPDSLTNPFPTDQMFPSFLTEGLMGPQFQVDGNYINVNPGFAATDLANTLVNPVKGIAGMVSPLIRVPAELLSGSTWQTGSKIKDTSDYLDQNLPVINYIANLTGVSPTGSLGTLATGQGLDPQAQVAAGNKTGFDQALTAINWLTGINAQNWSRPNFVNYAEIEKRNQAGGK